MSASTNTDTSASLLHLCGRKHKSKMGANLNEAVATGPNAFARKQLEKLGWTEGTGLGKHRNGTKTHIRVTKRKDEQGIGAASTDIDPVVTGEQWWKSSVGNTLARLSAAAAANKKKKKSSKKDKKSSSSKKDKKEKKKQSKSKKRKLEYTDEELFEATGGARFGMRAQTQQNGKWNRAEKGITVEEEETALKNTEWDGMSAPKVVLKKDEKKKTKKKTKTKSENSVKEEEQQDEQQQPPKKKRRKTTTTASSEDNEDEVKDKKKDKKSKKSKKKDKKSSE